MNRRAFLATVGTLPTVGCLGLVRREDSTARSGNPVRQSLFSTRASRVGIVYAEASADESVINGVVVNFRDEPVNVEIRAEFYFTSETAGDRFTKPRTDHNPANDGEPVPDAPLSQPDDVLAGDPGEIGGTLGDPGEIDGTLGDPGETEGTLGDPTRYQSDAEAGRESADIESSPSEHPSEPADGDIVSTQTYPVFGLAGREGSRFGIPFPAVGGPTDGIEFRLTAVVTAVLRE